MSGAAKALAGIAEGDVFDVAVLGAGAAGFSAAINAALSGAKVILIESTEFVGGSSAYSAGTTWIPNTLHAKALNADDSFEKASGFLDRAVGNRSEKAVRDQFLAKGPEAIERLEAQTEVNFRARPFHPDYLYELEGSTSFGRALEPLPFDARVLGDDFDIVRRPIPELTILGGLMIDRDDIKHLLGMTKSVPSFWHAFKLVARYGYDRLRYSRGTRFLMGNALIARMLKTARDLKVEILTQADVTNIAAVDGRVSGITVTQNGVTRNIAVRGGVVLTSGGFSRHPEKRLEHIPTPSPVCPGAPGHLGKLHDIVFGLGAHYGQDNYRNVFMAPVSYRTRKDGTTAVYPHFFMDRTKPGMITVNKHGKRFVNETTSYHLFCDAMYNANEDGSAVPAYLITDTKALTKYGIGIVHPGGKGLQSYLDEGYLVRGDTLEQLAANLGIDAVGLKDSVRRNNDYAKTGVDLDFARGTTVYERANGDADHGPNPTLGELSEGPFYAVRLYPGDIGSSMGLVTDVNAQVVGADDAPIAGLYAAGNDMNSVMGGTYPGPGITLGPAITFGYVAGTHAAERAKGVH